MQFIYCCFQLPPQGISIMMTSALRTCFIIFFQKIKMDLGKVTKNLGLTLLWISILDRACTYISHTDTSWEILLRISKNSSHSARTFCFPHFYFDSESQRRGFCQIKVKSVFSLLVTPDPDWWVTCVIPMATGY